jgi:hypothetical protein
MIGDVHRREETAGQAANRAPGAREEQSPGQPPEYLLDLQQKVGNAAVTRLVQRAPKGGGAASTDIADVSGSSSHGHSGHPPTQKKPGDVHARVIKYDIDQETGLITIGSGPDQGVQVGMSGSLLLANGTEYADFTIEEAHGRVSKAHVHANLDQVSANPQVVIKASSFAQESMEGKEF